MKQPMNWPLTDHGNPLKNPDQFYKKLLCRFNDGGDLYGLFQKETIRSEPRWILLVCKQAILEKALTEHLERLLLEKMGSLDGGVLFYSRMSNGCFQISHKTGDPVFETPFSVALGSEVKKKRSRRK